MSRKAERKRIDAIVTTVGGIVLTAVVALVFWTVVLPAPSPASPASPAVQVKHPKRHGGCVLAEQLGPEVKVCRDGTVWHRKVDGHEYMGNLFYTAQPPILVPTAGR